MENDNLRNKTKRNSFYFSSLRRNKRASQRDVTPEQKPDWKKRKKYIYIVE